jgi:REP element-mobilizing transposase RayT
MPIARSILVDRTVSGLYHCISRCVRRAFLCGDGYDHRRDWIRDRLQELSKVFAIDVAAYSVLSNHFHVVLRNMPDRAASWSAREVVRRWAQIHPSSVLRWAEAALAAAGRVPEPVTDAQAIAIVARDDGRVAVLRDRLSDLSWFMKGGEGIGAAPSLVVRHKR